MEQPPSYDGDRPAGPRSRRDHAAAIDAAARAVDDVHSLRDDSWKYARSAAFRTYLLDVAGVARDDLDDGTVRWLDWIVGWDTDVHAGLAAFIDAAKAG